MNKNRVALLATAIALTGALSACGPTTDEEAPAGLFLQLADVLAHGRLAEAEPPRRFREAAGSRDHDEGAEQDGIEHRKAYREIE